MKEEDKKEKDRLIASYNIARTKETKRKRYAELMAWEEEWISKNG